VGTTVAVAGAAWAGPFSQFEQRCDISDLVEVLQDTARESAFDPLQTLEGRVTSQGPATRND